MMRCLSGTASKGKWRSRDSLFATGLLPRSAFCEMLAALKLRRQAPVTAGRILAEF